MVTYCFGCTTCNSQLFFFKIVTNKVYLQRVRKSCSNQVKPAQTSLVSLVLTGFFPQKDWTATGSSVFFLFLWTGLLNTSHSQTPGQLPGLPHYGLSHVTTPPLELGPNRDEQQHHMSNTAVVAIHNEGDNEDVSKNHPKWLYTCFIVIWLMWPIFDLSNCLILLETTWQVLFLTFWHLQQLGYTLFMFLIHLNHTLLSLKLTWAHLCDFDPLSNKIKPENLQKVAKTLVDQA